MIWDKILSAKVWVLGISTWLFYIDKLTEDGWITVTLSITGMRVANEVMAMYKDIRVNTKVGKK